MRAPHLAASILALLLGASCASDLFAQRGEAPAKRERFFRGTVRVHDEPGKAPIAEYPAIVKRTLHPEQRQIVEESVVVRPGQVDHQVVVYDLVGEGCLVSEDAGSFSGTCELEGEPWRWSAWRSVVQMPVEGQVWTVEREDKLTTRGMVTRRWLRAADGTDGPQIWEDYESISQPEFEAMYLRALRKP